MNQNLNTTKIIYISTSSKCSMNVADEIRARVRITSALENKKAWCGCGIWEGGSMVHGGWGELAMAGIREGGGMMDGGWRDLSMPVVMVDGERWPEKSIWVWWWWCELWERNESDGCDQIVIVWAERHKIITCVKQIWWL